MAVEIVDARESGRYEARVDGSDKVAGIAQYIRTPELIAFVHTEVEPANEGQGVGAALVRESLDTARAEGLRVLAVCPFYSGWIQRHPEYADLLYQSRSSVTD
ncbi:N-acetyltransferase [Streptomyces sp. NBC_00237]|uniref:GNAT family N-acetyltransferase n=1 Tax=Streptomyces sp. NBC_00237 TaxID=2975687 RepID=UPI00225BE86E|nr:GNAT family N-acetyltransferase [Streptomyces sp. NBC_00237]MCX5202915.1 N-acetyltransferase [Streptomyces sp. NBC_00237]